VLGVVISFGFAFKVCSLSSICKEKCLIYLQFYCPYSFVLTDLFIDMTGNIWSYFPTNLLLQLQVRLYLAQNRTESLITFSTCLHCPSDNWLVYCVTASSLPFHSIQFAWFSEKLSFHSLKHTSGSARQDLLSWWLKSTHGKQIWRKMISIFTDTSAKLEHLFWNSLFSASHLFIHVMLQEINTGYGCFV
jgi:hypothetical protein